MTQLYSLRSTPSPDEFIVTKFDEDWNPIATYAVSPSACSGPDGHRPTCKHRKMLTLFRSSEHIDDGWFLDWDTRMWQQPSGIAEIADQLLLDNAHESPTPTLGIVKSITLPDDATPEQVAEGFAKVIAPSFESEGSIQALSPSTVEPASAAPVVAPPPSVGAQSSVGGANLFKRRRIT